ncbi:MAG: thioesterase family protein [Candidatus Sericytochromatia bacterium]
MIENIEKNLLNDYKVIINFPLVWGEMDTFNHINNVNYIRYFESSRIKYFELIDYFKLIEEKNIGPILASISCKYKAPLKYPDIIYVGSKIYKMSNDRFWMKYAIASKKLCTITTEGDSVLVSYDYNSNKKIDLPESIRLKIMEIDKNIEII